MEVAHFGPIVGRSAAMRELFAILEKAAPTQSTVLIQGESGTGKELAAEAIHQHSARSGRPFIVFDCSAVTGALLESELFGHEKGSFTGAVAQRAGCLEEADGGTLFLDEIGELPLELQPKLLRAVEKREIRPVGANRTRAVDLRLIAATHRDLAHEVNRGTFREDLYYRLAVVHVRLPPLRERPEDLPLLTADLVERLTAYDPARGAAMLESITPDVWARLGKHPWRGNVRELRNLLERRLALDDHNLLEELPPSTNTNTSTIEGGHLQIPIDLHRPYLEHREHVVAQFERAYLVRALEAQGGNFSRAAAAAGIDRAYFKRLLRKYQPG